MTSTRTVKLDPLKLEKKFLKEAADILINGGLVIMPTDTVYGIAADASNPKAVERLYEIKKRPKDKPFSLLIGEKGKVEELATAIPVSAYKLIDKFWPGPLTLILNAKAQGKVGLRLPDNEIALTTIALARIPLVCPSANISGKAPPVNFEQAIKDLNGLVDFAIDSGSTKFGVESSLVDLTVQPAQVLRTGAIKNEDIEEAAGKKTVLFVCTGNSCRSVMAKALLEKMLREKNRSDVEVLSAGIMITGGLSPTEETKEILEREGMDVSGYRSQKVTEGMLKKSDVILVMERLQERRILELYPEAKNRLFLLKEFAKIDDTDLDIVDPIAKPLEFYESTFGVIKEAVERISNII